MNVNRIGYTPLAVGVTLAINSSNLTVSGSSLFFTLSNVETNNFG